MKSVLDCVSWGGPASNHKCSEHIPETRTTRRVCWKQFPMSERSARTVATPQHAIWVTVCLQPPT